MKKKYFIPACVLLAVAVGFIIFALGLNCIALLLNGVQQRKQKKKDGTKQ